MLSASSKSILVLLCLCLSKACKPSNAPLPSASITPTIPTPTSQTIVSTYEPVPSPTSLSPTPSPTQLPTSTTLSGYEVVLHLTGEAARAIGVFAEMAVGPDGTIWIYPFFRTGSLYAYSGGTLVREICLESVVDSVMDLEVNSKGIWILDTYTDPYIVHRVVQLGFHGEILASYEIPKKFFIGPDGRFDYDFGVLGLAWGGNGELLLEGGYGVHQLLNARGEMEPKKLLIGYPAGGHIYRVLDQTDGPNSGVLFIDEKQIRITGTMDNLSLTILGFAPDSSVYLEIYEFSDDNQVNRSTFHHYSPTGELLAVAREPEIVVNRLIGSAFGADYNIYYMVSLPDRSIQVLRLIFEPVK